MKAKLNIYVGSTAEDPFGTYMYLELKATGQIYATLWETERLTNLSDGQIYDSVGELLNRAAVWARSLKVVPGISFEEIRTMCSELDCDESSTRQILELVKEFITQLIGDVKNG